MMQKGRISPPLSSFCASALIRFRRHRRFILAPHAQLADHHPNHDQRAPNNATPGKRSPANRPTMPAQTGSPA